MDTKKKLAFWMQQMGYTGKIPDSLGNICNPSTAFIWDQLISKIKPRQEVEQIRKNIIINRLKNGPTDEHTFPVQEIELYEQKTALMKKLSVLEKKNADDRKEAEKLFGKNKILDYKKEIATRRIAEHEQKAHILRLKQKQVEKETENAYNNLNIVRNQLQRQVAEGDVQEITKFLKGIAEKLKIFLKDNYAKPAPPVRWLNSTGDDSVGILGDDLISLNSFNDFFLSQSSKQNSSFSFEEIDKDESIKESTKTFLIHNGNKIVISNCFSNLLNETLEKLRDITYNYHNENEIVDNKDVSRMYYIHIKMHLDFLKLKKLNNSLRRHAQNTQDSLFMNLNCSDEIREISYIKIEEFKLDQQISAIKTKMYSQKLNNENDLKLEQSKLNKIKDEIISEQNKIKNLMETTRTVFGKIENLQNSSITFEKKIQTFTTDSTWADPLKSQAISREIEKFADFPLDYNRKTTFSNRNIYYRNLPSYIPLHIDFDHEELFIITHFINNSRQENVLMKLNEINGKLKRLKTINQTSQVITNKLKGFEFAENIESLLEGFHSLLKSQRCQQILEGPKLIKEIIELWMALPVRDYISPKTLIDGHDYKYYEERFDYLVNAVKKH